MVINELYINDKPVDLPKDFSVRLNRQLLHPAELNSKDAQASYTIELPKSDTTNAALGYANVEETQAKFNKRHTARLCINGIEVFNGFIKLTGIEDTYKANLYIPAAKTAKDVFGDIALNALPEYRIPFGRFAQSISAINSAARTELQPAIFPFAMYGLLPKVPLNTDANSYSPRTVWDDKTYVGVSDIPPSLNLMALIRHMFETAGYAIRGTAFDDARLNNVYMSYKNKPDYVMPWNFGLLGRMELSGEYDSIRNMRTGQEHYEKGIYQSDDGGTTVLSVDLLNSSNGKINIIEDIGGNVIYNEAPDAGGVQFANAQVFIPTSGLYKIQFDASLSIDQRENWIQVDPRTGITFMSGDSSDASNNFNGNSYEFKLLRSRNSGGFGLEASRLDGVFYRDNQPQNTVYDENNIPKYMPQVDGNGQQIAVDVAQNKHIVGGMHFGRSTTGGWGSVLPFTNPRDPAFITPSLLFPKPAGSWNAQESTERPLTAYQNVGYWKYGRVSGDGSEGSNDQPLGWELTNRYEMTLNNAIPNYVRRGQFEGQPASDMWDGQGRGALVLWLEAGETLTVASVTSEGRNKRSGISSRMGMVSHKMNWRFSVEPFQTKKDWLKVDELGTGTAAMNWNDATDFDTDSINLAGFLSADVKANEFIDNVEKAFNLQLVQTGAQAFELNIKQSRRSISSRAIDIDAGLRSRANTPLGLPEEYRIGFTVDTDEEGYEVTKDDGGGTFTTSAIDGGVVEQKSFFSYNWFKQLTKNDVPFNVPVITKKDAWDISTPYPEAMAVRYTDQAYRFWYYDGLLNDLGLSFSFNDVPMSLAKVSNVIPNVSEISYKNKRHTLLDNYFTLLIGASSHYTEVETYLSPEEYKQLNGAILARYNSDLYYVAEIQGYDPTNRNKTKIKLIRKI